MASIWRETAELPAFGPLEGDREAEAVVIGGGMAGVLTAYLLEMKGVHPVLIEADRIASGVTQGTTAKITTQHGVCYSTLVRQFGVERAAQYAGANEGALDFFAELIATEGIDCDFRRISTTLYATKPGKLLEREYEAARSVGLKAELTDRTELPFPVWSALRFGGQAEFHPLKFLAHLAKKLEIYEGTKALTVEDGAVVTDRGKIRSGHIVVATHFPFINRPGYYFLRMHQERSYVVALENAGKLENAYLGVDGPQLSLRSWGDVLLLGGGNHRTGENASGGKYAGLLRHAERLWPESRAVCRWSAQDCMPHDNIPYIGRYGPDTAGLYVATGFHKWGMTGSMTAAMLLSDLITGRPAPYTVFSPRRSSLLPSLGGLAKDGTVAVAGWGRQIFSVPREKAASVAPGEGGIVEHDGHKVGVYRDEAGKCHMVETACPHMGCQLTWNADETSWDCRCHGSRFDTDGKRLDSPAQENLHIVEDEDETASHQGQREKLL